MTIYKICLFVDFKHTDDHDLALRQLKKEFVQACGSLYADGENWLGDAILRGLAHEKIQLEDPGDYR